MKPNHIRERKASKEAEAQHKTARAELSDRRDSQSNPTPRRDLAQKHAGKEKARRATAAQASDDGHRKIARSKSNPSRQPLRRLEQ
jgi:hypothetical protein